MRWFVGIPVPWVTAHEVAERMRHTPVRLDRARLAAAEDLHVTLRFFGELAAARASAIVAALSPLRQPAFPLELTRVGAFRNVGAIYAAVAPSSALDVLAEEVNEALAWHGFPRELRPFHPHVTLARMRRALPQAELDRWSGTWEPIHFDADRLTLFCSRDRDVPAREKESGEPSGLERDDAQSRYQRVRTFYLSRAPARSVESL